MEKGFIRVFKMKMELILHCTYILDSITLCSGGGKVGSWMRCGTGKMLWKAKQEGQCGYFVKRGLKHFFFKSKTSGMRG